MMKLSQFISVEDVPDPAGLVKDVLRIKEDPTKEGALGQGKELALLFFNPSLRTRLSSQRAARIVGMTNTVLDVGSAWPLEYEPGAVMNQDKSEHVIEAANVISQYCDIMGIRSFPSLKNREEDYQEPVLQSFVKYGQRPILNLESATRHPLQGLTDMATIEEKKKHDQPKIVLTWAPHPKALPQSVANSFVAWSLAMGHDLTITHPPGYELSEALVQGAKIEYDPMKAYEDADFVYAKNWSSYQNYGQILSMDEQWRVDSKKISRTKQAYFMHCLPVRRNVIVDDVIIDSKHSLVIDQANNRTFAAAAVLKHLLQTINAS